jgi:transposase
LVGGTFFCSSTTLNGEEDILPLKFEKRSLGKLLRSRAETLANKRDNFSHQESRKIVDGYGIICVEDLKVNRMVHNHCLSDGLIESGN